MDASKAGIRLILETEKIAYNAKKKIVTKPAGKKIPVENNKAELILGNKFIKIKDALDRFGLRCIIPLNEYAELSGGKPLAWLVVKGSRVPAVAEKKDRIEFAFDIGKVFLELVNEKYLKITKVMHGLSNPIIERLYKAAPYGLRRYIYRRYYKKVHNNLKKISSFKTSFPIDAAGYVLHSLLIEIIKNNSDYASIKYWPDGYQAAFMLTHDVEPTSFSYKKGIFILLNKLKNSKSTINLVGRYAGQNLKRFDTRHEVGCHGYVHDRRFALISRAERENRIISAKKILEEISRKKVTGFRAPAMQKTRDMYKILWANGFEYDMSMIDSQREEPGCGSGISYNYPYHLFDFENKGFERILEIPTSAPDCISPLYFGYSIKETAGLFEMKLKWIREMGGVCNFIVHAPCWGNKDAKLRMYLLDRIQNIGKKGFWIATGSEVSNWWRKRENVILSIKKGKIRLKSKCDISGLVVLSKKKRHAVNLEAGKERFVV